jgi:acyl-coenzyme A thioesterase PaaI-like protein
VHNDSEPGSFVGALGMELWEQSGYTHGRADVKPEMLAPGTDRLRMGVLATMVDLVAGFLPTGPVNPTVDLRVTLVAPPPTSGTIFLVCRPAKLGRRLYVGETTLHTGDESAAFARSTTTFINEIIPGSPRDGGPAAPAAEPIGSPSFDDLLRPRYRDGAVEIDLYPGLSNGPGGTLQGGAQALLAELAAQHVLGDHWANVVDLDIRYLNRVRSGPVTARADARTDTDRAFVRVVLTDAGDDDRLVSVVSLISRRTLA